ncbi:MAG TPA: serine--tRNA ligase [Candidatus Doudnabacteria bacterium]|nr:serine--tRNA ligase [Candidatus Doudnabacteria bacterium]
MLDIKYIRDNTDKVKQAIVDKAVDLDLDRLLDLDAQRRTVLAEVENLQATKNSFSKELPQLSESDKKAKILEMQELDSRQTGLKEQLRTIEKEFNELMLYVPNIPSPESPVGKDDSENVPWSYWSPELGKVDPKDEAKVVAVPTKFDFEPKDHVTLATNLKLVDFERGVEVSGFRGYYLKNEAVLMQNALFDYAIKKLREKGFELMQTPTLVREFALVGSGHFPAGKAEVYQVANAAKMEDETKEQTFLAGTSEPSLIAYYADQILDESQLPIKLVGISPCYRSEVGSYGKDTKGLYRVHEFQKVEQVVICKADIYESDKWQETLREISEELVQDLKLPYRVLNICTGDMGPGKYKMYDIETWMPGRNSYGETHSDSNLTDWQARRLNIRYRAADGQIKFVYTLNNTAFASPRILIAIMENYQQADGSIAVPEILQAAVGTTMIGGKKDRKADDGLEKKPAPDQPAKPEAVMPPKQSTTPESESESKPTPETATDEMADDAGEATNRNVLI